MDLNTLIREKLKEVLTRNNAALVARKKETAVEDKDSFGFTEKQRKELRNLKNISNRHFCMIAVWSQNPNKTAQECDAYATIVGDDNSSVRLGWPNLTVAVIKHVKESGASLKSGSVIIITHGAKGYYLTGTGNADEYFVHSKDGLSYATEMEIDKVVDDLNPAQLRTVLTHQYFAEFMTEAMRPTEGIKPPKKTDPAMKLLEAPAQTISPEVVEEENKSDDDGAGDESTDDDSEFTKALGTVETA